MESKNSLTGIYPFMEIKYPKKLPIFFIEGLMLKFTKFTFSYGR